MTIRHLSVFITVCETGSITRTAEAINIAQPAVSQTIRELENYYSVDLFNRINRKLVLTEHGKILYLKAKEIISDFDEFESLAHQFTFNPTLKIGVSLTYAADALGSIMSFVKNEHPNVALYTYVNNASEILDLISSGDLDFGIIEGFSNNPSIASEELFSDKLMMVCGKDFACPSCIQLAELSDLPLLLREKGSSSRDHLDKLCEYYKIKINPVMESISNHAIINAAVSCNGAAILPRVVVQHPLDIGLLREIKITDAELLNSSHIVWHKSKHFSPQQKNIFDFCRRSRRIIAEY